MLSKHLFVILKLSLIGCSSFIFAQNTIHEFQNTVMNSRALSLTNATKGSLLCFYDVLYQSTNLLAELSFVTLTIHLCNMLNDMNLVKPRKTCFITV